MPMIRLFSLLSVLFSTLVLVLVACRTVVDLPTIEKTEQRLTNRQLPALRSIGPEDYTLDLSAVTVNGAASVELTDDQLVIQTLPATELSLAQRGIMVCTGDYDYIQLNLTTDNTTTGQSLRLYHTFRGDFDSRLFLTAPLKAERQTYTFTTGHIADWSGTVDGLRFTLPAFTETQQIIVSEIRLIRNDKPSYCEPSLPVVFNADDFVLDYADRFTYFLNIEEFTVSDDGRSVTLTPNLDPFISSDEKTLCASNYRQIYIRMRVSPDIPGRVMQLFYSQGIGGFTADQSYTLPIPADGEFHEYVIPTGQLRGWSGIIQLLRLDPVTEGNPGGENTIEISDFRLMRSDRPPLCGLE